MYDQSSDPDASKNLATSAKAVAETLDGQLSDFRKKTSGAAVEPTQLDPAQEENLRALGYLGSVRDSSFSKENALIDAKDKIDFVNKLHELLFDEDRFEDASAKLHALVQQYDSEAAVAYLEFGKALIRRERYKEAVSVLRIAVEKMPDSSVAHYQLGLALIKQGQWDVALPEIQAATDQKPNSAQMHYYLATVYARLKQVPAAIQEFEKALELDPDHFDANLSYGRLLFLQGHSEAALPRLNRAVKANPESAQAHAFLADAYQRVGQAENAERERAKASQLKAQPPE